MEKYVEFIIQKFDKAAEEVSLIFKTIQLNLPTAAVHTSSNTENRFIEVIISQETLSFEIHPTTE